MTPSALRPDQELLDEIVREIRWDPRVDQAAIAVDVKDGIVTLSGQVDSATRRLAAYETVLRVRGVRRVIDNVEVAPGACARDLRHGE